MVVGIACGCRRETGSSASAGWSRSRGILSTRSGRQPAVVGSDGRATSSGAPAIGRRTCTIARNSGDLRVLKELWTNAQVSTDRHESRPVAESSHVPLKERARRGKRIRELPASSGHGAAAGKVTGARRGGFVSSGGLRKQDAIGCGRYMY